MPAYYNEIDPYAAQWLRNLIAAGHIAPGDVDERSIADVRADDLRDYTQCHFFSGIGGWSYALRLAGWPDDRPVWTGSCPCQPFSAAGAGKAADDERHLWPTWFSLIAELRPAIVFGEQVEAAIGWGWLDAVFSDLEGEGYACGASVLPACGVGAPHIRQRLWFVADSSGTRTRRDARARTPAETQGNSKWLANGSHASNTSSTRCATSELATADGGNANAEGLQRSREHGQRSKDGCTVLGPDGLPDIDDNADGLVVNSASEQMGLPGRTRQPRISLWSNVEFISCTDGKARPVEPGTFPLAHGISGRVGRLRAYGNAIVPQAAAEFIAAFAECRP